MHAYAATWETNNNVASYYQLARRCSPMAAHQFRTGLPTKNPPWISWARVSARHAFHLHFHVWPDKDIMYVCIVARRTDVRTGTVQAWKWAVPTRGPVQDRRFRFLSLRAWPACCCASQATMHSHAACISHGFWSRFTADAGLYMYGAVATWIYTVESAESWPDGSDACIWYPWLWSTYAMHASDGTGDPSVHCSMHIWTNIAQHSLIIE
jgi:hypothetical protein